MALPVSLNAAVSPAGTFVGTQLPSDADEPLEVYKSVPVYVIRGYRTPVAVRTFGKLKFTSTLPEPGSVRAFASTVSVVLETAIRASAAVFGADPMTYLRFA